MRLKKREKTMEPAPWTAYESNVVGSDGEVIARCDSRRMAFCVAAIPDFIEAAELADTDPANALRLLRIAAAKAKGIGA